LVSQEPPTWGWSLALGASHWRGLETPPVRSGQLDPLVRHAYNARGVNLEIGGFRERRLAAPLHLQVGGSFGVLWHESPTGSVYRELSSGRTQESRAALNAGHLSGSLAVVRAGSAGSLFAGLGAGVYMLVFKETFGGWTVETSAHSYALGGSLTAGMEFHRPDRALALRLDAAAHFVSFRGPALEGGRLQGPLLTLRIGAVVRGSR